MNQSNTQQAAIQVIQKVSVNQAALSAAVRRCTASTAQVQQVMGTYAALVTAIQRDLNTVLGEQAASLQGLADIAAIIALQDSPHAPGGGRDQ
jgi:hypothetical protein